MKKSHLAMTVSIILFFTVIIIFNAQDHNQLYGNDKDSIKKYITSTKGFEDKTIQILEIKDIGEKSCSIFIKQ